MGLGFERSKSEFYLPEDANTHRDFSCTRALAAIIAPPPHAHVVCSRGTAYCALCVNHHCNTGYRNGFASASGTGGGCNPEYVLLGVSHSGLSPRTPYILMGNSGGRREEVVMTTMPGDGSLASGGTEWLSVVSYQQRHLLSTPADVGRCEMGGDSGDWWTSDYVQVSLSLFPFSLLSPPGTWLTPLSPSLPGF